MNIDAILNAKIKDFPWPHAVIEDVLDPEELDSLCAPLNKFSLDPKTLKIIGPKGKLYSSRKIISIPSIQYGTWGENELPQELKNKVEQSMTDSRDEILTKFGRKPRGSRYYVKTQISITPPQVSYPIHTDLPSKTWTMALYASPKQGQGTLVYGKDKKTPIETPWKINSGLAFAPVNPKTRPNQQETWHSYQNTTDQLRICWIINIVLVGH